MSVTREAVLEKLSTIKGPDLEGDIVSLGLAVSLAYAGAFAVLWFSIVRKQR